MEKQDRYDELDNIVRTLDVLIDEITDNYYIDMLKDIKYEAQTEMEDLEEDLEKEQLIAEQEMNYDFERSRIWIYMKV